MPYSDIKKRRAVALRVYYAAKGTRYTFSWKTLCSILHYAPSTGLWTWEKTQGRSKAGTVAGTRRKDYVIIRINNCSYLAHRLAWFYMTKRWPTEHIDHKNRDGLDNRWSNLREASRHQNLRNSKRYKNNQSGFKGVRKSENGKKWIAEIFHRKKHFPLGRFDSPEAAHAAYLIAAKRVSGAFARSS